MTIEEVIREEFEKEGIEVTIIEDGFLENTCVIDTSKHDKQIRADAIAEVKQKIDALPLYTVGTPCHIKIDIDRVFEELRGQK